MSAATDILRAAINRASQETANDISRCARAMRKEKEEKPMKLMMLDLETLSTRPDAVVWQIGAVVFNPNLDANLHEGEPGPVSWDLLRELTHFQENVDVLAEIMRGGHVDEETVKWWQERPVMSPREGSYGSAALNLLFDFWEKNAPDRIVANSPSFDCVIIENMARRWGRTVPWSFRDYLDQRTVRFVHRLIFAPQERREVSHDALDDCRNQAEELSQMLTQLMRLGGSFEL